MSDLISIVVTFFDAKGKSVDAKQLLYGGPIEAIDETLRLENIPAGGSLNYVAWQDGKVVKVGSVPSAWS
jgi:hypothetical protein